MKAGAMMYDEKGEEHNILDYLMEILRKLLRKAIFGMICMPSTVRVPNWSNTSHFDIFLDQMGTYVISPGTLRYCLVMSPFFLCLFFFCKKKIYTVYFTLTC